LERSFEMASCALAPGPQTNTKMGFDVFQELTNGVEDDEDQHCQILV